MSGDCRSEPQEHAAAWPSADFAVTLVEFDRPLTGIVLLNQGGVAVVRDGIGLSAEGLSADALRQVAGQLLRLADDLPALPARAGNAAHVVRAVGHG